MAATQVLFIAKELELDGVPATDPPVDGSATGCSMGDSATGSPAGAAATGLAPGKSNTA